MSDNIIEVYEKNNITLTCTVSGIDSLAGYTSTLTVKENKDDADSLIVIDKNGNIDSAGAVIEFSITSSDNDIECKEYVYDITITDGTKVYTIVLGKYRVLKTVSY